MTPKYLSIPDRSSKLQTYPLNRHFKVSNTNGKSSSFYMAPYELPLLLLSSTVNVITIHQAAQARNLDIISDFNLSFIPLFSPPLLTIF